MVFHDALHHDLDWHHDCSVEFHEKKPVGETTVKEKHRWGQLRESVQFSVMHLISYLNDVVSCRAHSNLYHSQ